VEKRSFPSWDDDVKEVLCALANDSSPVVMQVVSSYNDVFEERQSPIRLPPVRLPINVHKALPASAKIVNYSRGPDDGEALDADHDGNVEAGIVEESDEAMFVTPRFVVRPRRQRVRVVYDLRAQNKYLKPVCYPVPTFAEVLDKLQGASVFSKLDLKAGYHQVQVHAHDRWMQVYSHRNKLYRLNRLAMGLACAPAIFQRVMTKVLRGCEAFTVVYLDDVLIYSANEQEHAKHVEMVLEAFRRYNVRLSRDKCVWATSSVEFLGRTVSNGKVSHAESYLDPILQRAPPQTLDAMRGWLGSINFIAGHIPQVSRVLKPFFKMVGEVGRKRKKKALLAWTDELLQLFAGAKEWIARNYQPVMLPDPTKPWRMYTDASRDGMGAALLQVNPATQRWEPVGFYSTLWALPKSYGVRDLELKAVHESVKHWKGYLRFD
jgi:hypothetical protein